MEEDDDDNEDEEVQEQEQEQQEDNDNNEESECTTTAAKSEGSDMSITNNIHNMHLNALDMYLVDALILEISLMDKTVFKEVVDGTLFKEVKKISLERCKSYYGLCVSQELQTWKKVC